MTDDPFNDYHIQTAADLATLKQITTDTLEQAKKTNGRVTKLEDSDDDLKLRLASLEGDKKRSEKSASTWKTAAVGAFMALIFGSIGSGLMLLLQHNNIIDVSVVSAEEYDKINP